MRTCLVNLARLFLVLILIATSITPALADNTQQQALLKAQGLLKQLAQQKAAADGELAVLRGEVAAKDQALAKLNDELEGASSELSATQANLKRAAARGNALDGTLAKTKSRLEATETKLREVVAKYRATMKTLAESEAAKEHLDGELADTKVKLDEAEIKNLQLYKLNDELLGQYQNKSSWDALLQREPAAGLSSVKMENQVQDYQDRAYEQLLDTNADAAPPSQ